MIFNVLLPIAAASGFDYRAPETIDIKPGDYVRVPFGKKSLHGVVWGKGTSAIESKKIREIEHRIEHIPPMSTNMRRFIDWVAWYSVSPPGMIVKMALSAPDILKKDVSGGQWPDIIAQNRSLTPLQQSVADTLQNKFQNGFSVTVLDGVTGSGKTEVYFDTIAACLKTGKQALVLLPEIALSVQWFARFESRFRFAPHIWHSGVTPARKRRTWQEAVKGTAPVVVGARSALFLPFKSLGLIVVDEEHDGSYKQEEGVIYQARDMAVARARHEAIPIVLVSATPSLETENNIVRGRYMRAHLPARHFGASLPYVRLIDMRREKLPSTRFLCDALKEALLAAISRKQQAMLFINRRGYAPLLLCRSCGHRFQCPDCTTCLVLHRSSNVLLCHYCNYNMRVPQACPVCKAEGCLIPCGPGVERVAEEARALLPHARVAVMTSDNKEKAASNSCLIQDMEEGRIDILIGTQMIAKGHHFANLALVGVVDADMGLNGGDLRASEHSFQLLYQLAGRAGRETTQGEVWLQTYMPEHPVMQALQSGDRDRFMQEEARMREAAQMPPYGKLAAIIIEGREEKQVVEFARLLVRQEPKTNATPLILGPAPAPLARLRGRYRYRILIKAMRDFPLQNWLAQWLHAHKTPSALKVKIDVDPYSFV